MRTHSAAYYDAIYHWKDYASESAGIQARLATRGISSGSLLDVACGTGVHLSYLCSTFEVEGVELSADMLAEARQRLPRITFVQDDMRTFQLGRTFDVVTCLFSAIGYMLTPEDLHKAIANMASHLKPGGWLLVEPFFHPDQFHDGFVGGDFYDSDELKIARVARSWSEGPTALMELHHLVGTPGKVDSFVELLQLGLYTDAEYQAAFTQAGLTVEFEPEGLMGRGLYLGQLEGKS